MFFAALFTKPKAWKQPKCPSTDEWIKKMWYIYTMQYCCYSVTKSYLTLWDPWTVAHQAPLSSTISWNLLKLMSIESVLLSNHLILSHPLLLLPSIFPSITVFSNELALHIRWPRSERLKARMRRTRLNACNYPFFSAFYSSAEDINL